ncbi:conserved hypothetical protein [Luminiphilus syltensis NOR5-1B]|uniref:Methyltransferase FkbM domain-containing protein n=1 Tax=Luminiphilus syltensis NOR5-1B TaxID=565045 RepID=B8KV01_9GAMM|nr:conserved hypothetical protein [Luminiphilus syltensis NOR5-1B]
MSRSDIDNSDVLIGLGINDDWSFEDSFKKLKDVEVFAYDASVSQKYFLKQFIKSVIRIDRPKIALKRLKTLLEYRRFFFNPGNHHLEKFVGVETEERDRITLNSIFEAMSYQNIFLKIDIEGSEYRCLDALISLQSRISGLVIEFHDCDINLKKIEKFISDIKLKLIHIHANNFAPVRSSDGLPLVLEITFSKYCGTRIETELPHEFDMANCRERDDIQLIVEKQ